MQALFYQEEFGSTDWRKLLRSRWQLLLAVLFAHILLIILWPSIVRQKNEVSAPLAFVVHMLEAPLQRIPEQAVPMIKPAPQSSQLSQLPVPNKPRIADVPVTPTPVTSEIGTGITVTPVPVVNTETSTPTLSGESTVVIQRDISKVIKQVEREMPNRILTDIKPEKSSMVQFGINVAAAARPRGTSYQNIIMSDGTAMTKVTTPAGSYCVIGAKPGADITRAPGIRTVTCGSY
ncbi:MAG: hypothetical protein HYR68_13065 [Burkholderiales bacterium]|nr:hypothetical protein [Burkholderiales bacterium]MBI3729521.1 hypothetical protein [Burkholderiales bacterium]